LLHAIVHSAGVQDRDGGIWLLATLFGQFPFLAKLFADSAYAGTALVRILPNLKIEIVKRSDRARGFVPLPRRWIVRTHDRLAEPLPSTGQGLGESQSQRSRFPKTCFHPPHVTETLQSLIKSSDGLLRIFLSYPDCPRSREGVYGGPFPGKHIAICRLGWRCLAVQEALFALLELSRLHNREVGGLLAFWHPAVLVVAETLLGHSPMQDKFSRSLTTAPISFE
jgi:hypothetical protein